MILRLAAAAALLALSACGEAPGDSRPDRILVVPAAAARMAATTARSAAPSTAKAVPAPTLTVAESALINTSEMWSEPIAPDAEEIVIE